MRSDLLYLQDILDAVNNIVRDASRGRAEYDRDDHMQTWMVYHIQIIGEAAQRLSQALRAQHPEVPWTQIAAMRNILVHGYFRIDWMRYGLWWRKTCPFSSPRSRRL
jgi:uncharacterized protein with HEPN domain